MLRRFSTWRRLPRSWEGRTLLASTPLPGTGPTSARQHWLSGSWSPASRRSRSVSPRRPRNAHDIGARPESDAFAEALSQRRGAQFLQRPNLNLADAFAAQAHLVGYFGHRALSAIRQPVAEVQDRHF